MIGFLHLYYVYTMYTVWTYLCSLPPKCTAIGHRPGTNWLIIVSYKLSDSQQAYPLWSPSYPDRANIYHWCVHPKTRHLCLGWSLTHDPLPKNGRRSLCCDVHHSFYIKTWCAPKPSQMLLICGLSTNAFSVKCHHLWIAPVAPVWLSC